MLITHKLNSKLKLFKIIFYLKKNYNPVPPGSSRAHGESHSFSVVYLPEKVFSILFTIFQTAPAWTRLTSKGRLRVLWGGVQIGTKASRRCTFLTRLGLWMGWQGEGEVGEQIEEIRIELRGVWFPVSFEDGFLERLWDYVMREMRGYWNRRWWNQRWYNRMCHCICMDPYTLNTCRLWKEHLMRMRKWVYLWE